MASSVAEGLRTRQGDDWVDSQFAGSILSHMRQKTYLTPEDQWDRTVAFVMSVGTFNNAEEYDGLKKTWHLGRITGNHKLFRSGDFVIIQISNGMAQRHPVWGASSKGPPINGFYLNYQELSHEGYLNETFVRRPIRKKGGGWKIATMRKRCRRALRKGRFDCGPLRFVEMPDTLVGVQPDSPPLREYILALARKGWRTPGKRE